MNPRESVTVNFIVHDVRTARKLRLFQGPAHDYAVGANQASAGCRLLAGFAAPVSWCGRVRGSGGLGRGCEGCMVVWREGAVKKL